MRSLAPIIPPSHIPSTRLVRSDSILVYGSTTKGGVVKRSDCILVNGSTTKGDVVKRSNYILVYASTTKGGVVERSDCSVWEHYQG